MKAPENRLPPRLAWRGGFTNAELDALRAECFGRESLERDWWSQVNRFSLGWICARLGERLVGFVNVAWDGGVHAFLLDAMVAASLQRRGLATRLVAEAIERARATSCEWLHVDFEPHLRTFYVDACGFRETNAGLIALK